MGLLCYFPTGKDELMRDDMTVIQLTFGGISYCKLLGTRPNTGLGKILRYRYH